MRSLKACAFLIGFALLAACGQNPAANQTAQGQDQQTIDQNAKAAGLMPDFAPLYPGAQVYSSIGRGTGPDAAGTVSFSSKDKAEDILAFYREKAKAAGMEEALDAEEAADAGTQSFSALKGMMGLKVVIYPEIGRAHV